MSLEMVESTVVEDSRVSCMLIEMVKMKLELNSGGVETDLPRCAGRRGSKPRDLESVHENESA